MDFHLRNNSPNPTWKFYTKKELEEMPYDDFKRIYTWHNRYSELIEYVNSKREDYDSDIDIEEVMEIIKRGKY